MWLTNIVETGLDHVRREFIREQTTFENIEEAFTSEHWVVRIYKVKKPNPVDSII